MSRARSRRPSSPTRRRRPNLQLIASLDIARRQMELEGYAMTMQTTELAIRLRSAINTHPLISKYFKVATPEEMVPAEFRASGIKDYGPPHSTWAAVLDAWDQDEFALDPTRLTVICGSAGFDGTQFKGILAERFDIQLNKTSRNSVLIQTNINNTHSDAALLIKTLADLSREIEQKLAQDGKEGKDAFAARVKSLMTDVPDLPNFSRFHDAFRENAKAVSNEGHMRPAFFMAYDEANCEYVKLASKDIDDRLKNGPELVSANFVIPYPPGFPDHGARAGDHRRDHHLHAQARRQGDPRLPGREGHQDAEAGGLEGAPGRGKGSMRRQGRARHRRAIDPTTEFGERFMQAFFEFLQANPYILLFFTVGMAVWVGKASVKGYGLGMVAAAVVVGAALATWASTYGVKLQLDNFAKSLFYYLFMYGVGLRVGPAFFNSLKKDGLKFTILAVVCAFMGLALVVGVSGMLDLPAGAAGGILAGSQTMSAAIGTAEMAVTQGAYKIPDGTTAEQVSAMIALGYGVTYIWGTVGIILICKYLPRWWGIDARKAAKEYEAEFGVANVDDTGLSGYRPGGVRAYRLENKAVVGQSIAKFRQSHPQYRIVNVVRNGEKLGADPDTVTAGRRPGRRRRQARGPDQQPGPDRARSAGRKDPQHPARPGGDPRAEQGRRRPRAEGIPAGGLRRDKCRSCVSSAPGSRSRSARRRSCSASTSSLWQASRPRSTRRLRSWARSRGRARRPTC